ncbi:hypothetical protein BT10792_30180 (plasmid) [Bacillus thuringiensis]|nr:hypothetical protein BT10792_30180 [Bacillus thuringiensis]
MNIINIIIFITYNYYFILLLLIIQMIIHFISVRTLHSSLFTYTYIFYNLLVNVYYLLVNSLTFILIL